MQNMGIEVLFKGINSLRLWQGLWVTIRIALISMVFSIILGFLLGMVMNIPNKIIKFICRIYLEIVRIMPQLVLLFLVYFGAAKHLGRQRRSLYLHSGELLKWVIWCEVR